MLSFGSCDSTRARNEKRKSHREAAVTIRPGVTCGAPPCPVPRARWPGKAERGAGRGSPRPSAGGRDLPCKLVPQGTGAPGPRWPRLPLTRRRWTRFSLLFPPTHTHHADIRVCRPAAKREFGQNFHIQSKTQSHDWVGEA